MLGCSPCDFGHLKELEGIKELARTLKFIICKILLGEILVYVNKAGSFMSDGVRES